MRARVRIAAVATALLLPLAARGELRPEDRRSDAVTLSPGTRAMQSDDASNPGMLAVLEGEVLWSARTTGRSCAECHGEAAASMRGVAARYPAWDEQAGRPLDLSGKIEACRTARQGERPLPSESPERLALAAFVGHQSRGQPVAPAPGAGMDAARARGRALFTARVGQLNLACATCHDDHWGRRLAGSPIPQGHPVGYPIYRLEWQSVGSLQRRLRNCMTGVRAEPYAVDAPEWVDLEAYLMERAAGLAVETPGVRP